jgi:hypothetical protein
MPRVPSAAAFLAGVACMAAASPAAAQYYCREFTVPVVIGGQEEEAFGQACRQTDGSWLITQEIAGFPPQTYVAPAFPPYAYPYSSPYWVASPWWFGPSLGGSFLVTRPFHHHGHFHEGHHGHFHEGGHRR